MVSARRTALVFSLAFVAAAFGFPVATAAAASGEPAARRAAARHSCQGPADDAAAIAAVARRGRDHSPHAVAQRHHRVGRS